jgi:hypothetical protein
MFNLTSQELRIVKKLTTPARIQDFLNQIPINYEKDGETCRSPRRVLRDNIAHCMEGAMFAALALRVHGHKPLVMDLKSSQHDVDHVVTLFCVRGKWGAISKTNHAVLRYREPIYRNIRELALSYFHEYFLDSGKKTMRSYSIPLDLSRFDRPEADCWMTDEKDIFYVPEYLDNIKHIPLLTKASIKNLRPAEPIEIAAGKLTEWTRKGKRNPYY